MFEGIRSATQVISWLIPGRSLFLIMHVLGIACFAYIVAKRQAPLVRGQRDLRFDQPLVRLGRVLKFWLGQWKHPRYQEQKKLWLTRIAEEGLLFAYGATEPEAGSDLGSLSTMADPVIENGRVVGYKITGNKQWIRRRGRH